MPDPAALIFTSVSLNAPPVSAVAFPFVSVSVTVDVPPTEIEVGLNALLIVAGISPPTCKVAVLLAAPATGVCAVVTPEVVFGWLPVALLVTLKITVQLPFAGIVIPVKLSAVCPLVNALGLVPAHVPVTAPPAALIFTSVSLNAPPVSAEPLLFASVRVTVDMPPVAIAAGLNALLIDGDARLPTCKLAVLLAGPAVGVCVVVTPDVVLGWLPTTLLVTVKITVQLPLAGIVIPLKPSAVCPPASVVGVIPLQLPVTVCPLLSPPAALIFTSASLKAAPVSTDELLFVSVKVTVEVPPG